MQLIGIIFTGYQLLVFITYIYTIAGEKVIGIKFDVSFFLKLCYGIMIVSFQIEWNVFPEQFISTVPAHNPMMNNSQKKEINGFSRTV